MIDKKIHPNENKQRGTSLNTFCNSYDSPNYRVTLMLEVGTVIRLRCDS